MADSPAQQDLNSRPSVTFDDRLWPVLAALLLLAGIGGASIYRVANFEDPRWWANGWTYLGSLAAVTLLLVVGVSRLDGARRGLQLAAVLSLLAHIALFLSLNQYRLVALADAHSADPNQTEHAEQFRAPDYHIRAPEDPLEEFEKPTMADPQEQLLEEVDRQQSSSEPLENTPLQSQPAPLPGETPEVHPQTLPLQKLAEAAPRLAPDSAELSRADSSTVEVAAPQSVPAPKVDVSPELAAPAPSDSVLVPNDLVPAASSFLGFRGQEVVVGPVGPTPVVPNAPQRPAESELAPLAPTVSGPVTMRKIEAPQIRSPQIADLPRPQSGSAEVVEEPQPLVPAPVRAGSGVEMPREIGSVLDTTDAHIAVRTTAPSTPSLTPRISSDHSSSDPSSKVASTIPIGNGGELAKSTDSANATPVASFPILPDLSPRDDNANIGPASIPPAPTAAASDLRRVPGMARLPVQIPAPSDVGGLAASAVPDLGIPDRRASQESQLVRLSPGRLLSRESGGPLAIDGRSREPAEAFARRGGARKKPGGPSGRMAEQTEAAIELGLVFLAKHQRDDGSWSLHFEPAAEIPEPEPTFKAETAATGLALLSFLGAGYDHYGGAYADVVQRALDNLVRFQKRDGDLYRPEDQLSNRSAWLYSHGIASIALCEAYGMTGDPALKGPAQRAINFIVAAQDPRHGAWRYEPRNGSDTSVSGWQLMALKSGELAGLEVPENAYERVRVWLDGAQAVGARYVYNPYAPNTPQQGHGRLPTPTMTAVGLLMQLYTGLDRDDDHMVEGAEYLLGSLPEDGTIRRPARDTYYWYYATQVMFHMRGKYWNAWNGRLHPLLVDAQEQTGPLAGSWDPRRPVPDRWGPHAGRIYVTTLNLLSLEVYYRHLPLYDSTAQ